MKNWVKADNIYVPDFVALLAANIKGADMLAHLLMLISVIVIHSLECNLVTLATG